VGHTGVYDAAVEAVSKTDEAVGVVYKACQEAGYILLITSDHGNAEQMINPNTGAPHTAHTTNPVPFIMTGDPAKFQFKTDKKGEGEDEDEGALCDVAPTVLDIMVGVISSAWPCIPDFDFFSHQGLPKPDGT
jgi:2,3-bisphosphoglycerate-independent phosphoglycerate mutase